MKTLIHSFTVYFLSLVSFYAIADGDITIRGNDMESIELFELASKNKSLHRFATLFTAQDVRDRLSNDEGLKNAIDWCKRTAVIHVFVESYRDGYTAERSALEKAKKAFLDAGIDVSGCVTTTLIGKRSTGWNGISCFTDIPTQEQLQRIFEYTASIFDEIMIDDFLFTDCECEECVKAKGDMSWSDYRLDLMVNLSKERILKPAKKVNPNVKIIIKYPQWYDEFHLRGYDVIRETEDFDKIWVGTETRDPDNQRWGRKAQYEAYYIMRWLRAIGGEKTGGGWYDPYGTHPSTYVEQARQTILAGAKESLLFCYGSLLHDTGPSNVEKLRTEIPSLFKLAEIVNEKEIKGILAPKPPNSDHHRERYVFDFVGMLGLPLVPAYKITDSKAIFLSAHALKDQDLIQKLDKMISNKIPILITDGLYNALKEKIDLSSENIQVLNVNGDPWSLYNLDREFLLNMRNKLLKPFNISFDAPNKVALYIIGDDHLVIENFNDESIDAKLTMDGLKNTESLIELPIDANIELKRKGQTIEISMSPRSLVTIKIRD